MAVLHCIVPKRLSIEGLAPGDQVSSVVETHAEEDGVPTIRSRSGKQLIVRENDGRILWLESSVLPVRVQGVLPAAIRIGDHRLWVKMKLGSGLSEINSQESFDGRNCSLLITYTQDRVSVLSLALRR